MVSKVEHGISLDELPNRNEEKKNESDILKQRVQSAKGDLKQIKKYLGGSVGNGISRGYEYITEDSSIKPVTIRIISISIPTIILCTGIGAGVGGAAGGLICGGAGAAVTGGPGAILAIPGVAAGAAIGAGAGAGIGLLLSTVISTISISRSTHYEEWRKQALRDKVYPIFQKFVDQDNELKNLVCPITHELPIVPVASPNGHVFEEAEIIKWLDQNPNNPCPMRAAPFTKKDLVYSHATVCAIMIRIKTLLKSEIRSFESQIISEGLKATQMDLNSNNYNILQQESNRILESSYQNRVDPRTVGKMFEKTYARFMIPDV